MCTSHTQTTLWLKSNEWLLDIWEITHEIQIDRIGCRVVITSSGGNTKPSITPVFHRRSNTTCLPLDLAARLNTTHEVKLYFQEAIRTTPSHLGRNERCRWDQVSLITRSVYVERPHVTSQIQNPKKQTGGKCFRWSVICIHVQSEEAENSDDEEVTNTDLTSETWLSSFMNKSETHCRSHGRVRCRVRARPGAPSGMQWCQMVLIGPSLPLFSLYLSPSLV